jgi:four helix bundle protein
MGDYRDLKVWQEGHRLALDIHLLTRGFPRWEGYALADQMRRAAISAVSNVAEGAGRTDREFARFVAIARGSVGELRSQLLLARDLGYLSEDTWAACETRVTDVHRMLAGLSRRLRPPPE